MQEPFELTEDMLVSDTEMRDLAAAVLVPPAFPAVGPQTVKPVFPAAKPAPAYAARELRILTVSTGGYALIVGTTTILGVAEADGRLLTLVSNWAKGA